MWKILEGDCLERLRELEPESVQTVVTSPPYWGLRDYGTATWEGGDPECDHRQEESVHDSSTSTLGIDATGKNRHGAANKTVVSKRVYKDLCGKCGAKRIDSQLGLESTPEEYVENLVNVFREVRRVLRDDGTVWLNLGDSYAGSWGAQSRESYSRKISAEEADAVLDRALERQGISGNQIKAHPKGTHTGSWVNAHATLKPKDLVGIPWRVAFALQADGWWLRSDIIWSKPNPMPESVTDRPTRAHEYIFLLTKSARYFWDADAIREEHAGPLHAPGNNGSEDWEQIRGAHKSKGMSGHLAEPDRTWGNPAGRNRRSVWEITTQPYPEAHFATFPPKLVEPCILAGSAEGDTVMDCFAGSGTTGVVALRHNRDFIGIELNPEYCELARNRIRDDAPLFNTGTEEGGDGDGAYGVPEKVVDKQGQLGDRRYTGFNQRWKERNDL